MDKRIFISYSRKDFEAVKLIKAEIERATGEECWMDMEGIPYDSPDFVEVIVKAIEAADVFLFMLSEHSQNSRIARGEITLASKKGKHIAFINMNKCEMSDSFTILFSQANICDYQIEVQRQELIASILDWLGTRQAKKPKLHPIKIGALYGLADDEENIHVKGTWVQIVPFDKDAEEGLAFAQYPGGNWGVIDNQGKVVLHYQWKYVDIFCEGIARVQTHNDRWHYIDMSARLISPNGWIEASRFCEGFACVRSRTRQGYMDVSGEIVIEYNEGEITGFTEGLARVSLDGKWGYINTEGELVVPCIWDTAGPFVNGIARVIAGDQYGYIDKLGKFIVPLDLKDDELTPIKDPQTGLWGYADGNGKIVIPCEWEDAYEFSEGLARIYKNGGYGFIDRSGTVVIPRRFLFAGDFKDGVAQIQDYVRSNYTHVTKDGELI